MSYFPDLGREMMKALASGEHVRAIGWLNPDHPYTRGEVDAAFLERLKRFVAQCGASGKALCFGSYGGWHCCEFCRQVKGSNNFGVPAGETLYIAPEMVGHYIEAHGYCPPAEFVAAVMRSPLPQSEEYRLMTAPFWKLHSAAHAGKGMTGEEFMQMIDAAVERARRERKASEAEREGTDETQR
jgi:hypothetical protein